MFFLQDVISQEAVAVSLFVEMAHELSPAQELANEAFSGGEGDGFGGGAIGYVVDEIGSEETAEVEQDRCFGVEELEVVVAHGVFEAAEVGEEMVEEEMP